MTQLTWENANPDAGFPQPDRAVSALARLDRLVEVPRARCADVYRDNLDEKRAVIRMAIWCRGEVMIAAKIVARKSFCRF